MSRGWSHLCLWAALAGGLACNARPSDGSGPIAEDQAAERLARAHCEQLLACTCDTADYPNTDAGLDACVAETRAQLEMLAQAAQSAGHTYDGACAAQIVSEIQSLGCGNASPPRDDESCQRECFVYHGGAPIDDYCDPAPSTYLMPTANCEQGLYCENYASGMPYDLCADPCLGEQVVGEGQNCGRDIATCAEGLWCGQFGCTPNGSLGEPCGNSEDTCTAGLVCDRYEDPSVCLEAIPEGGACLTGFANYCDPAFNLRCVADVCVPEEPWICRRW